MKKLLLSCLFFAFPIIVESPRTHGQNAEETRQATYEALLERLHELNTRFIEVEIDASAQDLIPILEEMAAVERSLIEMEENEAQRDSWLDQLADSLDYLADLYDEIAESAKDEEALRQVKTKYRERMRELSARYGANDWQVRDMRYHLAHLERLQSFSEMELKEYAKAARLEQEGLEHSMNDRNRKAAKLIGKCLQIREKLLGESSLKTLRTKVDYAFALRLVDDGPMPSVELHRQVKTQRASMQGKEHPEYLQSITHIEGALELLAEVAEENREFQTAAQLHQKRAKLQEERYGADNYRVKDAIAKHTSTLRLQNLDVQALDDLDRAESLLKRCRKLLDRGLVQKALVAGLDSLELRRKSLREDDLETAATLLLVSSLQELLGKFDEAVKNGREADTIESRILGELHPDRAFTMGSLASLQESIGNDAEAMRILREAASIQENTIGQQTEDYAYTLTLMADTQVSMKNLADAISLYRRSMSIQESVFGKEHEDYIDNLASLAEALKTQGEVDGAMRLLLEAKQLSAALDGETSESHAESIRNIAGLQSFMGNHRAAINSLLEFLSISEVAHGKSHYQYATGLRDLGIEYTAIGAFEEAIANVEQSSRFVSDIYGTNHAMYAQSLHSLASVFDKMGRTDKALPLYIQSMQIEEEYWGKESLGYARSIHSLAMLYTSTGQYDKALPLALNSRNICERLVGKEHHTYASTLDGLSYLYSYMGDKQRALELREEQVHIASRLLGENNPSFANALNNLAMLYREVGETQKALPLLVKCKEICETALGKEHHKYALSLAGLAAAHRDRGELRKALLLLSEAKSVHDNAQGSDHYRSAQIQESLGNIYLSLGDNAKAEKHFVEASETFAKSLGREHPLHTNCLNTLGAYYASIGNGPLAVSKSSEAVSLALEHLNRTAEALSEQQQLLMIRQVRYFLDNHVLSCLQFSKDPEPAIREIATWKGSVLSRSRQLRLAAQDPAIATELKELQSLASQISVTIGNPPNPNGREAWENRLKSLDERKRVLEADLLQRSKAFREAKKPVSFEEIVNAIPDGGALIDFNIILDGRFIVASVIRKDRELALLSLGSGSDLADQIDLWLTSIGTSVKSKEAGNSIRKSLWEPLLPYLEDCETIIISGDGALGRLPLAALPGRKPGSYLIEDHRIVMIPVPRLLPELVNKKQGRGPPESLLLMGNVDYNARPARLAANAKDSIAAKFTDLVREPDQLYTALPGTKAELDSILKLFQSQSQGQASRVLALEAGNALETRFQTEAPSFSTIHLATHGFFAAADKMDATRSPSGLSRSALSLDDQRDIAAGFSPGLLSGLVFAGANRRDALDQHDGIMTADEISYLPLNSVDLVVLSACETGLGEVAGGEGLLGLQRAFQVSGANSVVASYWEVDDWATQALMTRFYQNLWERKLSKLDALREAQLWMLKHPEELKASAQSRGIRRTDLDDFANRTPPRLWAAFALSGDWR